MYPWQTSTTEMHSLMRSAFIPFYSFSFCKCLYEDPSLTFASVVCQTNCHFSITVTPDMTIEKLQKVATSQVDAEYKAKWLHWWNSSTNVHLGNKFPSEIPLKSTTFEPWLNKASFWAQVRQAPFLFCKSCFLCHFAQPCDMFFPLQLEAPIAEDFVKFEGELQQAINWDAFGGIMGPKDYIDRWRILLWDRAFLPLFVAKDNLKFTKDIELRKMDGGK